MWLSVRHFVKNGPVYEERVTVWDAQDFESAIDLARNEAEAYAKASLHDGIVLDTFQVYALFEPPAHGTEVFSLIRDSDLAPANYVKSFFDTGQERQSQL